MDMVTCECGDMFPVNSYGAGYMAAVGMCENCVAAAEAGKEPQSWKGMPGAVAFHLIERHSIGWSDIGDQMEAWARANYGPADAA